MKGRLSNFIKSFLEDRTIQVRVGSTRSDLYDQEQGVPQGAILSTTLFNVKLNDIINCLDYKQMVLCTLMISVFVFARKICAQ